MTISNITRSVTALTLLLLGSPSHGEPIAEDGFGAFIDGQFVGGVASGSEGWTGAWQVIEPDRISVVSNPPEFQRKAAGLGGIAGGQKALQLTTSNGSTIAFREYPPIDIPFYIAFLFSIESLGSGGGALELVLLENGNVHVAMSIVPDLEWQGGGYFGSGSSGSFPEAPLGTPHLFVIRIQNPKLASSACKRLNPTAATTYSESHGGFLAPDFFNAIGFRVGRTTSSGSDSVFKVDELRIGLTRSDVLPDAPFEDQVSDLQIQMLPRISFYGEAGKSYFVQKSFDLGDWINKTTISGNGSVRQWTDSVNDGKAFYRVVESP